MELCHYCGYKATDEEIRRYRWVKQFDNPYVCKDCFRYKSRIRGVLDLVREGKSVESVARSSGVPLLLVEKWVAYEKRYQ